MNKTITVKGVGNVTYKPDYVVVSMHLKSLDPDYDKAMELAAQKVDALSKAFTAIGFEKSDLKTNNFEVDTQYNSYRDKNDKYHKEFEGYLIKHYLELAFDYDLARLAQVLSTITASQAVPEFDLKFTVKNPAAVNEALLRSATRNAKVTAKLLCEEAGVELGELLLINYDWSEIDIYSHTQYRNDCLMESRRMLGASPEIQANDIDVSDTASFVWAIK